MSYWLITIPLVIPLILIAGVLSSIVMFILRPERRREIQATRSPAWRWYARGFFIFILLMMGKATIERTETWHEFRTLGVPVEGTIIRKLSDGILVGIDDGEGKSFQVEVDTTALLYNPGERIGLLSLPDKQDRLTINDFFNMGYIPLVTFLAFTAFFSFALLSELSFYWSDALKKRRQPGKMI